jgi:hypothetical protein
VIGPAGFMAGPQGTDATQARYIVQKHAGSEWARVIDTQTGRQVGKYSVLKFNGWQKADNRAAILNRRAKQHEGR